MEVIGLVQAVVQTADLCLKYGQRLVEICTTFKHANDQVDDRVLKLRSHWKRTSLQLNFLKKIWQSLDEEHRVIQSEILDRLISKLKIAITKIEGLNRSNGQATQYNKLKFVVIKDCLDAAIKDLASWQQMFDPSWFLIMKVADPLIDEEINRKGITHSDSETSVLKSANSFRKAARLELPQKQSIFLPEDGLKSAKIYSVPYSAAKYIRRAGAEKWFIIDSFPHNLDADVSLVTQDVRRLASKLSCEHPYQFGILQCKGVVRTMKQGTKEIESFDFIFTTPEEATDKPETLRGLLLSQTDHSLTERFSLAKQLARSISYIHSLNFVHKNVRPETVLNFPCRDSKLGLLFLVGFENVRMVDGRTARAGDVALEKNLYRHPDRQGLHPEQIYVMQHDIYSLGVCLLEIGLWESFVVYPEDKTKTALGELLQTSPGNGNFVDPVSVKERLVELAKSKLSGKMGDQYEEVVLDCLTCLDEDNINFGDPEEFKDADGVKVGVRYINKILSKLDTISV